MVLKKTGSSKGEDEDFAISEELQPLPELQYLNEKMVRFESLCDDLLLSDEDFYDDVVETLKFASPAFNEKDDF